MKYTDEQILGYARAHVRHLDHQKGKRLVLAFMGITPVVVVVLLVRMLLEKSEKAGGGLFQDVHFISGVAFGIFAVLSVGIAVLGFLRMFSVLLGKDIEVYRLLLRLHDENQG